jgi:hypothetical protein
MYEEEAAAAAKSKTTLSGFLYALDEKHLVSKNAGSQKQDTKWVQKRD